MTVTILLLALAVMAGCIALDLWLEERRERGREIRRTEPRYWRGGPR